MKTPKEIVNMMLDQDYFSKWMRISVDDLGIGYCTVSCEVNQEMLNGFAILHGGISYSLSDSALAFAANSYGYKCVSIETSISHIRPASIGNRLKAKCTEVHRGKTIGIYSVEIFDNEQKLISKFKGTVNISNEIW